MGVERTGFNNLKIQIYSSGTTLIVDPDNELPFASIRSFSTFFPGGLFGDAEIFVPRDVTRALPFKLDQRLVVRNGQSTCYEGVITGIAYDVQGGEQGNVIQCAGYWGQLLGVRTWSKPWADNRISRFIPTTNFNADKFELRTREFDRIAALPKNDVIYGTANKIEMGFYQCPSGETVKRITFNYNLSEIGTWQPEGVKDNALTDQGNAFDDDATTSITVTLTTGQFFYIGSKRPFDRFYIDFGATVNANVSTLTVQYHNGTAWGAVSGMSDGTAVAGKTWAQDGWVTFTEPGDQDPDTLLGSSRMYWFRLSVSANLTASIVINEIYAGDTQAWKLGLWNNTAAAEEWSVTTTSSGSQDESFATPDDNPGFFLVSEAGPQRGIGNDTIYGRISNIVVYTETGSINPTEIIKDIRAKLTELNSDESQIGSNTLTVVPFVTNDHETFTSILTRIVSYGDSSRNTWDAYLLESDRATSPNGEPVLAYQQRPALTDYDYAIRLGEDNLIPPLSMVSDLENVANWIVVRYRDRDEKDSPVKFVTPDDDANLKDTTSIATYGERHKIVNADVTNQAGAISFGRRYLAAYKDAHIYVSGPINIKGALRKKDGSVIPTSQVRAGQRIKIENFLTDLVGVSGAGLTEYITQTRYDDASETVALSTGVPDELALFVAESFVAEKGKLIR